MGKCSCRQRGEVVDVKQRPLVRELRLLGPPREGRGDLFQRPRHLGAQGQPVRHRNGEGPGRLGQLPGQVPGELRAPAPLARAQGRPGAGGARGRAQDAGCRVRNITAAIAKVGLSSALAEQLQSEEEKLRSLRERAATSTESHGRALAAPDPKVVVRVLEGVLELAEKAPERARTALARVLVPITLKPVVGTSGECFYEAHGAINTNPAALSGDRVRGSVNGGCGGRI